ncbi:MAG: hypothetical protein QM535_01650 [Limnohabitans sp.]|nr:hypothetical protein [Limnohabitans sp.]
MRFFLNSLLLFFFTTSGFSQMFVNSPEEIDKARGGITYVIMNDPDSQSAKPYKEVLQKNWTFSTLKFIKRGEKLTDKLKNNTTFLLLNAEKTEIYSNRASYNRNKKLNEVTYVYLTLFNSSIEEINALNGLIENNRAYAVNKVKKKTALAQIQMFGDPVALADPSSVIESNVDDTGGHVKNWTPALLKIYIKAMQNLFDKKESCVAHKSIANKHELSKLKTETLYIPEYLVDTDFGAFSAKESIDKNKPNELFEKYTFPYKVLSKDEFEKSVLNSKDIKYVFVYVKNSSFKYVSVFNANTGEIVYNEGTSMSFNVKDKDVKSLFKEIEKAN